LCYPAIAKDNLDIKRETFRIDAEYTAEEEAAIEP
jgi:hypothetical protein